MSIPRDLKVDIPTRRGIVTDKINAAYALGGPSLSVRVGQGPAAHPDQPRRQRELRRLPARGEPPRLRVRRRRPRLLQRQQPAERQPVRLRDDQHQPGLPEALRQQRARLRPLPPLRRRPRPRRAPAVVPVGGQGADRPRADLRRPQGAAADLRPLHADRHRAPEHGGDPAPAEARLRGLEEPDPRGPLPRRHRRDVRDDLAERTSSGRSGEFRSGRASNGPRETAPSRTSKASRAAAAAPHARPACRAA